MRRVAKRPPAPEPVAEGARSGYARSMAGEVEGSEAWTARRVLAWATEDFGRRGIGSARLDAELLLSEALSIDRVGLYMGLERPLSDVELGAFRALVVRRRGREPIAYILGRREFYGRSFAVSPAVLVPRPDTETLVERALERLPWDGPARVLDLCCGSGAIGLTLAAERPDLSVDLSDVSSEALAVTERNREALGVAERTRCIESDLFARVEGRYHLIACNPPYVRADELPELAPDVRDFEPALALVSGQSGLEIIERVAARAGDFLEEAGALQLEIGAGQAEAVESILRALPWVAGVRRWPDLTGVERVVEAWREGGQAL